ncbi:MAG: thrombospondin type 3 repeat-containing protein [Gemmatimonadota bacterium]|nr:thrombospondin type 3 repeat-containing protein [Gemmatimonadota bacterium]MDH5804438.1 thrombospondin type 3 repeat-containing protein [Gemmatimonadota bacterium]
MVNAPALRRIVMSASAFGLAIGLNVNFAQAQQRRWSDVPPVGVGGQLELGTYGSFNKFSLGTQGLNSSYGAGGRMAFFLTRFLSVEASGDFTETTDTVGAVVRATRMGGTVFLNTRAGLYFGGGYERTLFRENPNPFEENGFHIILGPRLNLGGRAAFRFQGRATWIPSSAAPGASGAAMVLSASAGLSVYGFGGPPRDRDGDGVWYVNDQCPDTPGGVEVDPGGCPMDSDSDEVYNGLDQCPNTPSGALVDSSGCPTDEDSDSIFDGIDQCPGTPAGAMTDQRGCPQDSDNDNVYDGLDQCPSTPNGAIVDENGCPTDEDQDGVYDGIDQCTNTPVGSAVNNIGCAIQQDMIRQPQLPANDDVDGDGVANAIDQCPNTPAGLQVNAEGCAPDADSDNVPDVLDQCPNTQLGTEVDAAGCALDFDNDGVPNGIDQCPNTAPGQEVDLSGCPPRSVDDDGDGVINTADQCPNTPAGTLVDGTGCPMPDDDDGDGVVNDLDQCPGTPAGTTVGVNGCPLDDDGDGVTNNIDQCPGTPAGTQVDGVGCPVSLDDDNDGVMNNVDQCPGTPAGTSVDDIGCPVLFQMDESNQREAPLVLEGVTFATGSSRLTPNSSFVLDQVAQSLMAYPDVRVEIGGHTDDTGSLSTNRELSLARAQSVMAYLASQGVPPGQMEARGYGPDQPVATNTTAEGRAQNRRVELKRIDNQ